LELRLPSPLVKENLLREFILPSRNCRPRQKMGGRNTSAPELCKPEKSVEEQEVSERHSGDFHMLINTCVEILTYKKYFIWKSALVLLCRATL